MSKKTSETLRCFSPANGQLYVERALLGEKEIAQALSTANRAQKLWAEVNLVERQTIVHRAIEVMRSVETKVSREITEQMGRPIGQTPGEVNGFAERAAYMTNIAENALADVEPDPQPGFHRFIRRSPLGVVFVIAPWNYPYLTAVNAVVPALLAGNAVLLKHSSQTPLCSERFAEIFSEAGLPPGVLQSLHLSHASTLGLVGASGVDFVAFTGSVEGGHAIQRAASKRFIATGLELGGKDPAYVAEDADPGATAPHLIEGAFFNSGQSCCGIERIYAHRAVANELIEAAIAETLKYQLGDPLDPATSLGPMVRESAAQFVQGQINAAVAAGAQTLIDPSHFSADSLGPCYQPPQILVQVDHSMDIMMEESFGPVVGIMIVDSDEEALHLMNDSRYGLTASIWTQDEERTIRLGQKLATGTVFMNRCDYLDPGLAWTGVKESGRGTTLSALGYEVLTRPQSFHLRHELPR